MQARLAALEAEALRYKEAIDSISQGIAVFDAEERLVYCNRRYAEMYRVSPERLRPGASPQDIEALHAAARTGPKSDAGAHAAFSVPGNAGARSTTQTVELEDGRTLQISRQPARHGGWISTHEDITEIKALRSVADERISLQALIDSVPGYLWVKDTESRFVVVNRALASDSGYATTADMVGLNDFDIHPPEAAQSFRADELEIIRTGAPMTNRHESVVASSGARKWLLSTKMPLRNGQNEVFGIVGIAHDITERLRV